MAENLSGWSRQIFDRRWKVVLFYRNGNGCIQQNYYVEHIKDIAGIIDDNIESRDDLLSCSIVLNRRGE